MLFRDRRRLLLCYFNSSSTADPEQADSRPRLPTLQERHFMPCNLCMRNYFNFVDFKPDTSIPKSADHNRLAQVVMECKNVCVWKNARLVMQLLHDP